MTRLETLSPDLVNKLRNSSIEKQREASLAACEFAISPIKFENPLVEDALKKLHANQSLTSKELAELKDLVIRLDEEYFNLQKAYDEGRASVDDYLRVFAQARTVSSLLFACNEDAFIASTEAIYEAAVAIDNPEELFNFINTILE